MIRCSRRLWASALRRARERLRDPDRGNALDSCSTRNRLELKPADADPKARY
jgi:hypothetical protein